MTSQLLATDRARSPLRSRDKHLSFTVYGYAPKSFTQLTGFHGELQERALTHYLLGSYRIFNSLLMRFHSYDSLSPFGLGGINGYNFLDPLNAHDPTGHVLTPLQMNLKSIVDRQPLEGYVKEIWVSKLESDGWTKATNKIIKAMDHGLTEADKKLSAVRADRTALMESRQRAPRREGGQPTTAPDTPRFIRKRTELDEKDAQASLELHSARLQVQAIRETITTAHSRDPENFPIRGLEDF